MIVKFILSYCMVIHLGTICQQVQIDKSYTAAVVEYHPVDYPGTEDEQLVARAKTHINLLKNIKQDLEIIVYPEKSVIPYGDVSLLSTVIPKKFDNIICNSTDQLYKEYLKLFSCAAIEYNTTIAITILEKENNCKVDRNCTDVKYYNTVVVFNEQGVVSGRYRKWNLFGEFQMSVPEKPDVTVIQTKNNISFGVITCFDINFNIPAINLTKDLNIKNIIFPNNWISELPYLTSLQVQQMWSHENNVVLLASGGNYPRTGASGSGIYLGENGPLERVFIGGDGGTKVIVQTVTNNESTQNVYNQSQLTDEDTDELAKELDGFFLLRDLSMDDHTSVLMNENKTRILEEVCNGDSVKLCCNFDIIINRNTSTMGINRYKYHLATFNGIRSFSGLRNAGIEACGIVACLNDSLSSCGLRFRNYSEIYWPITFEKIIVEAKFLKDENRAQYPNSVLSSFRPILPKFTSWEKKEEGKYITRKHVLNNSQNRLLTFGIFGRDFSRDSSLIKPSNSGPKNIDKNGVIILSVLILMNVLLFK